MRKIQRTFGRFAVGVFSFCIITVCWLFIVSTLTGCELPKTPKVGVIDGRPNENVDSILADFGRIIDQYDLESGRKVFLVEVDIPFQGERCIDGCDRSDGNLFRVYQENFLRALHAQIAVGVDMLESQCMIESIAITNARGVAGHTLPSGAYVVIKCPEPTDAGTPE